MSAMFSSEKCKKSWAFIFRGMTAYPLLQVVSSALSVCLICSSFLQKVDALTFCTHNMAMWALTRGRATPSRSFVLFRFGITRRMGRGSVGGRPELLLFGVCYGAPIICGAREAKMLHPIYLAEKICRSGF